MNLEIEDGAVQLPALETGNYAILGGNIPGVQEVYEQARNQQIEASQPEVIKGEPLPSMPELLRNKKPTFKYISVTGFNRAYKRELANRLSRHNRKKREIQAALCSICNLLYTGPQRCQCPASKPARKEDK